jgi:hypothetical protein
MVPKVLSLNRPTGREHDRAYHKEVNEPGREGPSFPPKPENIHTIDPRLTGLGNRALAHSPARIRTLFFSLEET